MKRVLYGLFILVNLAVISQMSSAADHEWFCVTGDSLDSVSLVIQPLKSAGYTVALEIAYPGDKSDRFTTSIERAELQKILEKGTLHFVFTTSTSNEAGGSVSNAVFFLLERQSTSNKFKATLANKGTVYDQLSCDKIASK